MKFKFSLQALILVIALLLGAISISGISTDHVKLDTIGITNMSESPEPDEEKNEEPHAVIQLRR